MGGRMRIAPFLFLKNFFYLTTSPKEEAKKSSVEFAGLERNS
jgi:hypothetical protein